MILREHRPLLRGLSSNSSWRVCWALVAATYDFQRENWGLLMYKVVQMVTINVGFIHGQQNTFISWVVVLFLIVHCLRLF